MLLRFKSTTQALQDACEDPMDCYSNLTFREAGTVCIVSGSAHDMLPFLNDISNAFDLDEIIQDPPIA